MKQEYWFQFILCAILVALVSCQMNEEKIVHTKDHVVQIFSNNLDEFNSSLTSILSSCEYNIIHMKNNSQRTNSWPLSDEVSSKIYIAVEHSSFIYFSAQLKEKKQSLFKTSEVYYIIMQWPKVCSRYYTETHKRINLHYNPK